jgi:phosphohistidine phosphatase SixA
MAQEGTPHDVTQGVRKPGRARWWTFAIFLAAVAGLPACSPAPATTPDSETIILVIRHAEKSTEPGQDPPLNAAGEARARELVHVTRTANVEKIYASEFLRTRQTVQPLATALGLPVDASFQAKDPAGLANDILTNQRGRTVLVAQHSNTVPQLIELLGGGVVPPIDDAREFDRLYIVHLRRTGVSVTALKYGVASLP